MVSMSVPDLETFFDLDRTDYGDLYEGIQYPWEAVCGIEELISKRMRAELRGEVSSLANVGNEVYVGPGTVVEPGANVKGPAIIGENCIVRSGAYIRKNSLIGNNVTIGNSTEVKNSIIHDEAEIPHFSYVGDSVIGWMGHLGAGVKISNLKVNRESVIVHLKNEDLDTGMRKFGCLLGDRAEIGCNTVINPGTLIGKNTLASSNLSLHGYYPPNRFIKLRQEREVVNRRED